MLNHRVLCALLDPTKPFAFETFWEINGFKAGEPFSDKFRETLRPFAVAHGLGDVGEAKTLEELVGYWRGVLVQRGIDHTMVNREMEVVYRAKEAVAEPASDNAVSATVPVPAPVRHWQASKAERNNSVVANEAPSSTTHKDTDTATDTNKQTDANTETDFAPTAEQLPKDRDPSATETKQHPPTTFSITTNDVIGTVRFRYETRKLDVFLESAFSYMFGLRPPRGVGYKNVYRCR